MRNANEERDTAEVSSLTKEEIVNQFIVTCEEALVCLACATHGLEAMHDQMKLEGTDPGQRMWIGSNVLSDPRYHASISMKSFLEKSKRDGTFTSDMAKAFLCTLYALWDESCRPALAAMIDSEPSDIKAPLMCDLRKIRHCILHNKSQVPPRGLAFEVLHWQLPAGDLFVTRDMFRDVVDAVRMPMGIKVYRLSPEAKALRERMTPDERRRFDTWRKVPGNQEGNSSWPEMDAVQERLARAK